MRALRLAVLVLAAWLAQAAAAAAVDGHWQPPDIGPTRAKRDAVVAAAQAAASPGRGAHWSLRARVELLVHGERFATDLVASDAGRRWSTAIDGGRWESGHVDATAWRRNPAGIVHTLRSDLQGDELDRWPTAPFDPLAEDGIVLAGETRGSHPAWVLETGHGSGVARWLYIDEATADVVRETTREGSAVYSSAFDDRRLVDGRRIPFHWRTTGYGGAADVRLVSLDPAAVADADIAQPPSTPLDGVPVAGGAIAFRSANVGQRVIVAADVGGRAVRLLLDTGSTQNYLAAETARRLGLAPMLGRVVVPTLSSADVHLARVPFTVLPSIFGLDGVLGYDVFVGSVVHVGFAAGRVTLEPRTTFVPPAGARPVAVRWDEGVPLVDARFGQTPVTRCLLDTGSWEILAPRYLWEQRGTTPEALGISTNRAAPAQQLTFLEGPIVVSVAAMPSVSLSDVAFTNFDGLVERTNAGTTIDIPFDTIVGGIVLSHLDWWFDASGGRAWAAVVPAAGAPHAPPGGSTATP